ncbi:MAG: hypothetical protein M1380_08360 [Chloroflexi bacterium]|nr:hypothetical protein [Chloroflexota bacterium]
MNSGGNGMMGVATPRIERGLVLTSYGYVHYRAAGAGPPIVMLHTHRRASTIFVSTMKALAGTFRCYAIDLLGHGAPTTRRASRESRITGSASARPSNRSA